VSSVVGGLQIDRGDVSAVLVEAVVEPVDTFGAGQFNLLDGAPGVARFDQLSLVQPLIVSTNVLSYDDPTVPTEGWIPASASRSVNQIEVYRDPRSVWCRTSLRSKTLHVDGSRWPAQSHRADTGSSPTNCSRPTLWRHGRRPSTPAKHPDPPAASQPVHPGKPFFSSK